MKKGIIGVITFIVICLIVVGIWFGLPQYQKNKILQESKQYSETQNYEYRYKDSNNNEYYVKARGDIKQVEKRKDEKRDSFIWINDLTKECIVVIENEKKAIIQNTNDVNYVGIKTKVPNPIEEYIENNDYHIKTMEKQDLKEIKCNRIHFISKEDEVFIWMEENTGLIRRVEHQDKEGRTVSWTEYEIKINEVKEEELKRPDLIDYLIVQE